jgi:hypothetical protein
MPYTATTLTHDLTVDGIHGHYVVVVEQHEDGFGDSADAPGTQRDPT